MRVAIGEFPEVETVAVSLNERVARIRLKPGNALSLTRLRQVIEESGFTPQDAVITARAVVRAASGQVRVLVSGPSESLAVEPAPGAAAALARLRDLAGRPVLVRGTVPPPKRRNEVAVLRLASVEPIPSGRE